jgi:hypothetical protein
MAQKLNLVIDQGTTFSKTFVLKDDNDEPMDLSVYTARSKMKKSYFSSNSFSFTATCNSSGVVSLSMDANTTSSIVAGRYVYDVELVNGSYVTRAAEGIVTVTPEVTT